jgi:hypothetical protein
MIKKILPYLVLALLVLVGIKTAIASEVTGNLNPGLDTGISGTTKMAPTLSPVAGNYNSTQTVSLTAAGSSKICYTTNGDVPSCATATTCTIGTALNNGGTISVSSASTIKSAACYADDSTGPLATSAYTFSCATVSNAATYNAYPTCGVVTCNSGYIKSGNTCVASGGGGGGGGGGGASLACTSVTYTDWGTTCFNNKQYRSTLTLLPTGCNLTAAQQADTQRACETSVVPPVEPEVVITPVVTSNPVVTPIVQFFEDLKSEAQIVSSNNTDSLLNHLGNSADVKREQSGLVKYKTILGLDKKITSEEKMTINDFIVYGTRSTQRLGAGERAAVINSYYQAYGKLPNNEEEWFDVIKIASGRWPIERNSVAENKAKIEFKKVYARNANMANNIDENAIMVIAYGLLPVQRNLGSEAVAIKTFRWVYGHAPSNALAWNVVRAIAYSGAKR